jgi:hypothetical protein
MYFDGEFIESFHSAFFLSSFPRLKKHERGERKNVKIKDVVLFSKLKKESGTDTWTNPGIWRD